EQISIPLDKPFIYLKGDGKRKTYVVWDENDSIATSATFSSHADNIIASSISFVNSYNSRGSGKPMKTAVAALIEGDKSTFYQCGFFGLQDTLWDVQGRHYFRECIIQGAVDFIFGAGQSLYESCTISVVAGALNGAPGYITAQARLQPNDSNGFVFKYCNIVGNGKTYLGRAWRQYARVIFYKTTMSGIVVPQGWDAWSAIGRDEQVTIPPEKPFIYLKGEGIGKTSIVWGAHDTMFVATFASLADNILVSGITFANSYNYPPNKNRNPVAPAVAARISGDKSAFYKCSFLGYQDTLLDDHGRHLFKLCTIEGAIDFIFGGGQSIYEKCSINVNSVTPEIPGFIAAQARGQPNESNGFVFKQCGVNGQGKAFLGRAWKAYSRVIYYESFLSNVVVPQGWDSWDFASQVNQITFSEHGCLGSGSDKSNRVKWEKNLTPAELQPFITNSYIDSDGWIGRLPLSILD
ncbi:hypothetical protein RD792_009708, partial [Penstemon davidsonii]